MFLETDLARMNAADCCGYVSIYRKDGAHPCCATIWNDERSRFLKTLSVLGLDTAVHELWAQGLLLPADQHARIFSNEKP